ncbi:MAG: hypothetical protein HYX78_01750 [Armatimonadetes bacterium]|nr:hypothetical protein [Armatimonadota bacterium]
MTTLTKARDFTLGGANRGGRAFSALVLRPPRASFRLSDYVGTADIYDPEGDRAATLARCYEDRGIQAAGHSSTIEEARELPSGLRGLFVDDLSAMDYVLSRKPNEDELQLNFLMATGFPYPGGQVLDFAATVDRRDHDSRYHAHTLIAACNRLVGGQRITSRMMMRPVQTVQIATTRTAALQKLVGDAQAYFAGEDSDSGLYVAETFNPAPPHVYRARVVPVLQEQTDEVSEEKAYALAQDSKEDVLAVVFAHRTAAWLHVEFLAKDASWQRRGSTTFPTSPAIRQAYEAARSAWAARTASSFSSGGSGGSQVTATD